MVYVLMVCADVMMDGQVMHVMTDYAVIIAVYMDSASKACASAKLAGMVIFALSVSFKVMTNSKIVVRVLVGLHN